MTQAAPRDLALERGFSPEVVRAFSIQNNGAGWKWQTGLLGGGQATRWKSYYSRRPEGDPSWRKYSWIDSKPADAIFLYPPGRSLAEAVAQGGGRLYLAGGEPAAMSLMSAGRWNSTSLFGDGLIPENLGELLRALGVKTLLTLADRDQSGVVWAGRIRDRLIPCLDIDFRPLALPYPLLEKHGQDVNDLWLEVLDTTPGDEDPAARFLERIDALEDMYLPEPERKTAPDMDYGLAPLDLPVAFLQAIEVKLDITHGFKHTGWTKKPVRCPFHDDQHPSANWNRHLGILHCFSGCGKTYLAKEVGTAFGLSLKDFLPTGPRIPLVAAGPLPAPAPVAVRTVDIPDDLRALKRGLRPPLPAAAALTDADLRLAATGRGFLDDYVQFAQAAAPAAPALFHEALGVWLLSAISTRRVALDAEHAPLFPNLYILLVARTTLYRKSTAMNQAERVLRQAGLDYLLLPTEFSTEAMFDTLAGMRHINEADLPRDVQIREAKGRFFAAQRSFLVDEASSIFALAKRDYGSGLHEMLLKGYDAPVSWSKSLKTRGLVVVRRPCLSFMGATTPIMMNRYFGNEESESGLAPRFVFVTPDAPPIPPVWPDAIPVPQELSARLKQLHWLLPFQAREKLTDEQLLDLDPRLLDAPAILRARFAPEARRRMDAYVRTVGFDLAMNETDQTGAVYGRLVVTAKKVAMLLAMGQMTEKPSELVISEANALAAIVICERWRESYHRLTGDVALAASSKLDEKVIAFLAAAGREGATGRDITRGAGIRDRRQLDDILTLLAEDGKIEAFPRPPRGERSRVTRAYRIVEDTKEVSS
jgi:hypothetical protein